MSDQPTEQRGVKGAAFPTWHSEQKKPKDAQEQIADLYLVAPNVAFVLQQYVLRMPTIPEEVKVVGVYNEDDCVRSCN